MDELLYLGFLNNSPLLLSLKIDLLLIKLEILKSKAKVSRLEENSSRQERDNSQEDIKANVPDVRKYTKNEDQLNKSQQKIFEFIKSFPERRTKDIIYEFNVLSGRSVKRNLNDLLQAGLIKRRIENKAVYYSVAGS